MKKYLQFLWWAVKIIFGCGCFALGFNLFLLPHGMNVGGISGLAMAMVHLVKFGTVGMITAIINLPLFALGGVKVGKRFFVGSLIGMIAVSVLIDAFAYIPVPETEPLIGALYGGVICGIGAGIVFVTGASTGGSDIIVRLLKLRYQNVPIGIISTCFDLGVAILTGLVFWDVTRGLYSGVAIFITGRVVDAVVYRFDYSAVALIVSRKSDAIAEKIGRELHRGATFLQGQGTYSGTDMKVILTAVKKQQLAELKQLVVETDPEAFIIVQEAHQVLGDGFIKYSKDAL